MRALDVTWQKALAQAKRYICRVDADAALVIESSLSLPKSMTESERTSRRVDGVLQVSSRFDEDECAVCAKPKTH